jgi:hypothetical protein
MTDIDFTNTIAVRDRMEQAAARLSGLSSPQSKAVSDYLTSIQKPDVTPETLIASTNTLQHKLFEDKDRPAMVHRNLDSLVEFDKLTDGIAHANKLSPDGTNGLEERVFSAMNRTHDFISRKIGLEP